MLPNIIDLQKLSGAASEDLTSYLSDYPKFKSVYIMSSVGLPVSKALIVTKTTSETKEIIEKELESWKVDEFLVRTDKKGGAVNAPAVQNCKFERVWPSVKYFLKHGLLPMIMAEGDVF